MNVSAMDENALAVESISTVSRRRREEDSASSSIVGLSAIIAQFAAIYGVNNNGIGNTDVGSDSAITRMDLTARVAEQVADLTTIDASSQQWSGQGLNIIGTPKQDQVLSTYVKKILK